MKIRTKLLALLLAAAVSVPFAFTSCDDESASNEAGNVVEAAGDDVNDVVEPEYAFTKAEFEANKSEILAKSVDYKELFGFDDETFALFFNENMKNGAAVDAELNVEGIDFNMSVSGMSEPIKGRIDLAIGGEGNPLGAPIDASVYYDTEQLSVASQTFLGESALGLKFGSLDELLERFVNSELGAMLKSPSVEEIKAGLAEMGITDEYINNVTTAFGDYAAKYSADGEYYTSFENKLYEIIEGTFGEVGEGTATVNGVEYEVYTLDSVADNSMIADSVSTVMDMYKECFEDGAELTKAILSFSPEAAAEYDTSAVTEELDMVMDELLGGLEAIDFNGTEKIYIDKVTGKYLKSDITGTIIYEGETINITGTEYITDNGTSGDIVATYGEETAEIKLNLAGESTESGYSLVLTMAVSAAGENAEIELGFVTDKTADKYEFYIDIKGSDIDERMSISGTVDGSADALTFSVDSIDDGYEAITVPYNKFTVKPVSAVEAHANVTDVFDLTQEDIMALAQLFEAMAA